MTRQHFVALDGLRGIAALLVMAHHIGLASGYPQIAPLGFLAVDLFFVLSGFVIAQAYEPRFADGPVGKGMGAGRFMAIRLVRLYPLIFLGLLLGASWSLIAGDGNFNAGSAINFLLLPTLLGGATMTFAFDTPVWSLAFEIVANFAHATLLWRIGRAGLAVIALLSGAALLAAMIHFASPSLGWETRTFVVGFFRIGFSYVVGILLYRIVRGGAVGEWRVPLIVPIIVLIAVLHGPLPPLWAVERGAVITFLVFPAIVVVAIHQRPTGRWAAAMTWLGQLSFPLYAIHLPIVTFAARLIVNQPAAAQLPLWILFVFVIVAAALALERRVDLPLRRWLRPRLVERGGGRREPAVS